MLGQREATDTGECVFDNEIYPVLKPCERKNDGFMAGQTTWGCLDAHTPGHLQDFSFKDLQIFVPLSSVATLNQPPLSASHY